METETYPDVGIVEGIPAETYHAMKDRVSKHQLDDLRINPARFRFRLTNPRERTPDMLVGDALHAAAMEPQRWRDEFIVVPESAPNRPTSRQINAKKPSFETMEAIEWWREFDAKAQGKTLLTRTDCTRVEAWAEAIQRHPEASALIAASTRREVTGFWRWRDKIPCKGRADLLHPERWILDVKTTVDAGESAFERQAWNLRYHVQAAWYLDGFDLADASAPWRGFGWILVEKEAPYDVAVRVADEELIQRGREHYERDMERLAHCIETESWPAYPGIGTLRAPKWAQ